MIKKVSLLSIVMSVLLLLSACNKTDVSKSNSSSQATELRLVSMFGGEDPVTPVFKEIIAEFEAEHNVKIIDDSAMGSTAYKEMVLNDFATGNEADVTMYFTGSLGNPMVNAEKVVPLDSILKADENWKGSFVSAALEQVRAKDGNIYAVPVTGFYEGLIVNVDLFEKYNVELPTDWNKFLKAVEVFKSNDIAPMAVSLTEKPYYLFEHTVLKTGGAASHDAGIRDGIEASWIAGLNLIKDLYDMGAFQDDALTATLKDTQELFKTKKAAMIVEGSWFLGGVPDHDTVKVLAMPKVSNTPANETDLIAGFSSGYYLSKKAYDDETKRDLAIALVKHLTDAETIKRISAVNGGVPAVKGAEPDGLTSDKKSGLELLVKAANMSLPIDAQIKGEAFKEIIKGIPQICEGAKTAEEVLELTRSIEIGE